MHSFASALIAAALVTLTSAAPVDLPVNAPSLPIPSLPVPNGAIGQLTSVGGSTLPVRIRDTNSVEGSLSNVLGRGAQSSIADIFDTVSTATGPSITQLNSLNPSDFAISQVSYSVNSIKTPILAAVGDLEDLVGADVSVILAPIDGTVELTVAQVATIVSDYVDLVIRAAGNVLAIAEGEAVDVVDDVEDILGDLGGAVTELVGAVLPLVDGLTAALAPLIAPLDSVIAELEWTALATLLNI